MKLTVDGVVHQVDIDRLENRELMDVEEQTGKTFDEWVALLNRGSITAITALVWILRRRSEPGLAFGDVSFFVAGLDVDNSDDLGKSSPDGGGVISATSSTTT